MAYIYVSTPTYIDFEDNKWKKKKDLRRKKKTSLMITYNPTRGP